MSAEVDGYAVKYDTLPGTSPYMRAAVERWLEDGVIDPGSFLWAVVTNDLLLAVGKADDENKHLLAEWARWFYNKAPGGSHGSIEKVKAWAKAHGR